MVPESDFDGAWKEFLDTALPDILAFCFPDAHADIDWSRGYSPLDTALQQVAPTEATGKQAVDKLMQVWLRDGAEAQVFIHLEVQSQTDTLFAERMFRYHARIYDYYRRPIVSLAILGDDRPSWRPRRFGYERWGCTLSLRFPTVKLLDFDRAALANDRNPCATVILAHLEAQATRHDPVARHDRRSPSSAASTGSATTASGYATSSASSNGCCACRRSWKKRPGSRSA